MPPVRALGRYFPSFTSLAAAKAGSGNAVGVLGRRAATAAAETVADMVDRWFNNYTGSGVGLYGGSFRYTGGLHKIAYTLHRVRLERNLAVSGSIRWRPYRHRLSCHLGATQLTMSGRKVSDPVVSGTLAEVEHPAARCDRGAHGHARWTAPRRVDDGALAGSAGEGASGQGPGSRLIARAMTRTASNSDTADSNDIIIFDQCLIADTSVGLTAVEIANDMCR